MTFRNKWAVVCDFDGTITTFDIGDDVCLHFGILSEEEIARSANPGISVENWMRNAFAKLNASPKEIKEIVLQRAQLRAGFDLFAQYCLKNNIPLEIASGGIDIYIEPLLEQWNLSHIPLNCARHIKLEKGYDIDYRYLKGKTLDEYKKSRVIRLQESGYKVIFCGDGASDYPSAVSADIRFSRFKLKELLDKSGIETKELVSFSSIKTVLENASVSA